MPTSDLVLSAYSEYKRFTAVNAALSVYGNGPVKRTGSSRVTDGQSLADKFFQLWRFPGGRPAFARNRLWHRVKDKTCALAQSKHDVRRCSIPSRQREAHLQTAETTL